MSAVLTTNKIIYEDPTANLSLQSVRDPNLELTRYLFTPGQFLDPTRVNQLEHVKRVGGGEEVETHCFRRTIKGFLPRAYLTPMEVWAEAMPHELIGEGAERDTVVIVGDEPPAPRPGSLSNRPGFFLGRNLRHVKFYPGDEIKTVLSANDGKGIVEITTLRGKEWYDNDKPGLAQMFNRDFFFNDGKPLPIELKRIEELIARASEHSQLHAKVAEEMTPACTQFRFWGETRLSIEHGLLRERKSHHYVHAYSPLGRELLRQLEMKPQDTILENNAEEYRELIKAAVGQNGGNMTPEMITQMVTQITTTILAAQKQYAPGGGLADGGGTPAEELAQNSETETVINPPVRNKGGRPRKNADEPVADRNE